MKKAGILLFYFITITSFAQQEPSLIRYKTDTEKLKIWLKYCDKILEIEDYSKLLTASDKGIKLSKNHLGYASKFYLYKGRAYEFDNNQYKKALANYELALKYARIAKHLEDETSALMRLNYTYYALNESSKRKQLINYIKKVLDTTKNTYAQSVLNGCLAEYYLDYSEYETFIHYQLRAINYKKLLSKSKINDENIGVSFSQIASAYIKMKHYNKAIEYLNYANPYIKTSPYISAFSCNYYMQCFISLKNRDSITKYYNLIYTYPTAKDSLFLNLSFANQSMAEYYIAKHQTNTAYNYAKKAVLLGKKSTDEEILMEANTIMGRVLYEKGNYKKAIEVLTLASSSAYTYDKEFYVNINKKLSQSYAALGLWKKATVKTMTRCFRNLPRKILLLPKLIIKTKQKDKK
jgi:hypothetical protein